MDITAVELDLTAPDGDGDPTAGGALVGLSFLLGLRLATRWAATTDK